jgi:hypothetical protein
LDFAKSNFNPISENDITCYLYYSLVAQQGMPIGKVHAEYLVDEGKKVDLFLDDASSSERTKFPLLVEIKLRKGRLDYYLSHCQNFNETLSLFGNDVQKLINSKRFGRGVATVFFQQLPPSPGYKGGSEIETLKGWEELESSLEKVKSKLKNEGIEILYGPRAEFYRERYH